MEERFGFVEEWNSGAWGMAELCRFYGVSRGTGYKWVNRYEAGGLEELQDGLPRTSRSKTDLPICSGVHVDLSPAKSLKDSVAAKASREAVLAF